MTKFKLFAVSAILLVVAVVFSSCKKDDPEPTPTPDPKPQSYFTNDGVDYVLSSAYSQYWGVNNGVHNFDIYIVSEDIKYVQSSEEFSGTGEVVYLELFTSSSSGLIVGEYNYSSENNAFSFGTAEVGINADSQSSEGLWLSAVGGKVNIAKDGEKYTISFNLTTDDNKEIIGKYEGVLSLLPNQGSENETYLITFDANGGAGWMPTQEFEEGVAQNLDANTFTRTGYVFEGWATSASSSYALYEDEESYTAYSDRTLYAVWDATTGKVRFTNTSSNPYYLWINDALQGTLNGNTYVEYTLEAGFYSFDYEQVSGYAIYPTTGGDTFTLSAGEELSFVFP